MNWKQIKEYLKPTLTKIALFLILLNVLIWLQFTRPFPGPRGAIKPCPEGYVEEPCHLYEIGCDYHCINESDSESYENSLRYERFFLIVMTGLTIYVIVCFLSSVRKLISTHKTHA